MDELKYHYSNPKFEGKPWIVDHKPKKKKKKRKQHKRKHKHRRAFFIHPYELRCRKYLRDFWDLFNTGKLDRLRLVCMAANPGWCRVDEGLRLRLRKDFSKRYTQYLVGISEECAICGSRRWTEKHHIIPLAFGGINDNLNLMGICIPCHDEIHPWMKGKPRPCKHSGEDDREPEEPERKQEEPEEQAWNLGKYYSSGYCIEDVEQEERDRYGPTF